MADYIVKDTKLTSVANAIRTAGGTNSLLSFPNGFISAVNNISGGGSSDFSTTEVTIVNNSGYETAIRCATYYDDEYGRTSSWSVYSDGQNDTVADIILYKGEALICCENSTNWSFTNATGDIEIDSEYPDSAYVSGNGTITLAHHD